MTPQEHVAIAEAAKAEPRCRRAQSRCQDTTALVARIAGPFVGGVTVEHATWTDESVTWAVVVNDHALRFECRDEAAARSLGFLLRGVTRIEVIS